MEDEKAAGSGTVSWEPRNKVILREKNDAQQYPHHHQNREQETKQSKYQKMMFRVGDSEAHDYIAMN